MLYTGITSRNELHLLYTGSNTSYHAYQYQLFDTGVPGTVVLGVLYFDHTDR